MENLSRQKTHIKKGDIFLCYEGMKIRPVVIVSDRLVKVDIDVSIAKVTSQNPRNEFDVVLEHWEFAGLNSESVVRCSKISYVHHRDLVRKVGSVHQKDMERITKTILKFFS